MIDLEKIYKSGQTFLWDEVVDKRGNVCYLVRNAGNWALVQQNGENYSIRMGGFCEGSWQEYFDDYTDYETIVGAFKQKGIVDDAVKAGAGLRILRQTPWEAAVEFIISQNNNIPRIKKCVDALARRFNGEIEVLGKRYAACLPKPWQIVEAGPGALEGAGTGIPGEVSFQSGRELGKNHHPDLGRGQLWKPFQDALRRLWHWGKSSKLHLPVWIA